MRHPRTLLALLVIAALFLSVRPIEADEKAKADPAKPVQPVRSPISTNWSRHCYWGDEVERATRAGPSCGCTAVA